MFKRSSTIPMLAGLVVVMLAFESRLLAGGCQSIIDQNDTAVCQGSSVVLSINSVSPVSVQWSTGATTSGILVTPVQSTVYYVTVFDGAITCSDSVRITVKQNSSSTQTVYRCQGQTYTLPGGGSVNVSGSYQSTLLAANGCDSVVTTNITFYPRYNLTQTISRCIGQTYVLPSGVSVTTNGSYVSNLTSIHGCDSIITSNVTFYPTYSITENKSICSGNSYVLPSGTAVSTAGTYVSTLPSVRGCDSVIVTNLTVNQKDSSATYVTSCGSYRWSVNNNTYTASGTYVARYTNRFGCDSSIYLILTVNRVYNIYRSISICDGQCIVLPGGQVVCSAGSYSVTLLSSKGCDSTINTTVSVKPVYQDTQYYIICQGQSFTLQNGAVVNTTGVYPVNYTNSQGCDSTLITDLTVNPVYTVNNPVSICQGQTYRLPGGTRTVNLAGNYTVTIPSSEGCDSTIVTQLTVNPVYNVSRTAAICQGDTFRLANGVPVTTAGVYTATVPSVKNCDSTIVTTLSVRPEYSIVQAQTICDNERYITPSQDTVNVTGSYPSLLTTIYGCDSLITTNLTVNPTFSVSHLDTICDGTDHILPDGQRVNVAGIYTVTVPSSLNCDSTVTTYLEVNPSYSFVQSIEICPGSTYTLPNGTAVGTSGTYPVTYTSEFGCDSIITTNLSEKPTYNIATTASICSGDAYQLPDGVSVTTAGTYPVTLTSSVGCDSTIVTTLGVRPVYSMERFDTICQGNAFILPNGQPAYGTADYPVTLVSSVNCDSSILTHLTVNPIYNISRNISVCQGTPVLLPDGRTVTAPGSYTVVLPTVDHCDSTIVTNVNVRPAYNVNRSVSICQGDTFTLSNGQQVTLPGVYTYRGYTIYGCDSVVNTILSVRSNYSIVVNASICQGDRYTLPGGTSTGTAGTYTRTFQSIYGCDSVITTTLIVHPNYTISQNVSICRGSLYVLPDNIVVSTAGNYTSNLPTVNGCDSIINTHLTVSNNISNTVYRSICQGETYTIPGGQSVASAGTYYGQYLTSTGCDSSVTIHLSVNQNYNFQYFPSICQGDSFLLPNGAYTRNSGTYSFLLTSSGGCDSSITNTLTVNSTYAGTANITICQGQTYKLPDGRDVTFPGNYLSSFQTPAGCDSTILTILSVTPAPTWNSSVDLCIGDTYILPDGTPTAIGGVFQSVLHTTRGCDSLVFTFVSMVGFVASPIQGARSTLHYHQEYYNVNYTTNHFYHWTVMGGVIDSGQGTNGVYVSWTRSGFDTLIFEETDGQCHHFDTLIINTIYTGIASPQSAENYGAYPVPFEDHLTLTWPENEQPESVMLFDLSGRVIWKSETEGLHKIELSTVDISPGSYFVAFTGIHGAIVRVIKN